MIKIEKTENWFEQYKHYKAKILEQNEKIKHLKEKEKKVEREFAFENLINEIDSRSKNRGLNTEKNRKSN